MLRITGNYLWRPVHRRCTCYTTRHLRRRKPMYLTIQAIVLRVTEYKDHDASRILQILSRPRSSTAPHRSATRPASSSRPRSSRQDVKRRSTTSTFRSSTRIRSSSTDWIQSPAHPRARQTSARCRRRPRL